MKTLLEDYPLYPVNKIESFQELLLSSKEKYPNKLALEDLNQTPIKRVTFSELFEYVFRFGKALKDLGIKERTHIALIGENRVQWGISYLAITTFNYVVVPIDRNLKENEILTILHQSDAKAVIFSENYRDIFLEHKKSIKGLDYYIDMDLETESDGIYSMTELISKQKYDGQRDKFSKINPKEMASLIFTSGTMGSAKGVMLSQFNISSNIVDMLSMIQIYPDDRFLSVLPIHHTYECTCGFLCPLYAGSSVHYARSLKTVVEDIQKVRATILLGVPLLYEKMYRRISKAIEEDKLKSLLVPALKKTASLVENFGFNGFRTKVFNEIHKKFGGAVRIFIVGGAAPNPEVARGLRSFGFNFIQGYGLTETSPIVALNRLRKFKDDAAGLPLPSVQVKIDNPDSEGKGEVVVKGPNVMIGYYKNPKATEEVLKDGWFYTGDYGYFDYDGFLHITGRKKNVIVTKTGKNIFPEEIEDHLKNSPFIFESVVYAAKDKNGDETIGAIVVPNAEEFIEYSQRNKVELTNELIEQIIKDEIKKLNRDLPIYKQIRVFQIQQEEFEKTTTQKIKRYLVKQETSIH